MKDGKTSFVISPEKIILLFISSFVFYYSLFPLVRTTINYSEMLVLSPLMPFSRFKLSPHAAVQAFLYGGGRL